MNEETEATRIPPHDLESEALVVGLPLHGDVAPSLRMFADMLRPEHFYAESHRRIFEAELEVSERSGAESVDIATVIARLTETGRLAQVGGVEYLRNLRNNVASFGSKRHREWAVAVHDAWRRRRAIATVQELEARAYLGVDDTQEFLEATTRKLLWLVHQSHGRAEETTAAMLSKLLKQQDERRAAREGGAVVTGMGVPTGLAGLDRVIRGLRPEKKITIAARPGRGKTALGMQLAGHACAEGFGVVYYNLEPRMSREDHLERLLASIAHVDHGRLVEALLDDRETGRLVAATDRIAKWPLNIVDARGWPVSKVRADANRRAQTFRTLHGAPLAAIVVDHLGAFKAEEGARNREAWQIASDATTALANLAADLKVAVVELAQEKRSDDEGRKKQAPPRMSDIYGGSEIEKTSEVIAFIRSNGETDDFGRSKCRLHIVKNSSGRAGALDLEFIGPEVRFVEIRAAAVTHTPSTVLGPPPLIDDGDDYSDDDEAAHG